ncbi:unnamed protein product [Alternaria alternata]
MARINPEQSRLPSVSPQLPAQTPNNNPMDYGAVSRRPNHVTKKFVLCFDGTGNKFSGTDSDSNILKIYRMLDRNGDDQFHYYQPGIGTYVTKANGSMTRTGRWERFQSWYAKAKDSAIEEKGSKSRKSGEKSEKLKLLEFMCAFRETFSRPVKPIRFLGLFDTVNSVPAFENAWMQRSRFPYTARSSANVIRHAVSIDERRAKFRQDLISQEKPDRSMLYKHRHHKHRQQMKDMIHGDHEDHDYDEKDHEEHQERGRRDTLAPPERFRDPHETSGVRSRSADRSQLDGVHGSATPSMRSYDAAGTFNSQDEDGEQDIQEDIGGGWPLGDDDAALSHVALVWMVREAQKAGLDFDEDKLEALSCCHEEPTTTVSRAQNNIPMIAIDPASPSPVIPRKNSDAPSMDTAGYTDDDNILSHHREHPNTHFHKHLHSAATKGRIHDVLQFNNGANRMGVVSWNIMEYLPFRRMDLQEDGTWKAIRWPLPKGETRDIPADAVIHSSVIKRMRADPTYRPGNLIVGGGGRGVRHAPKDMGMGQWVVACDEGHHVGECFKRRHPPERTKTDEMEQPACDGGMQGNYFAGRKKSTVM